MSEQMARGEDPRRADGAHMPTEVDDRQTLFDRFAEGAAGFISRAPFFVFCVLIILIWAPTIFVFHTVHEWQIAIHTITSVITFLIVALLKNSETRADAALQGKLNALAAAMVVLMEVQREGHPELDEAIEELRHSVGLESVESS